MAAVADKEKAVINVVRLRRAERKRPADADVAAVRMDLEQTAGRTLSRALAARLLGVSQTGLARWIATGDIPVVVTPAGRLEVPVRALVGLIEAIDERKRAGRDRHPLATVVRERRSRARELDVAALVGNDGVGGSAGHRGAEVRGLLYHRAVAQCLNHELVQEASERLRRWRAEDRIDPRSASAWEDILSQSMRQIGNLLAEDTPRMRDLRQSSPFAGSLSEPERRAVLDAVGSVPR